jgi:hypothetical protein
MYLFSNILLFTFLLRSYTTEFKKKLFNVTTSGGHLDTLQSWTLVSSSGDQVVWVANPHRGVHLSWGRRAPPLAPS